MEMNLNKRGYRDVVVWDAEEAQQNGVISLSKVIKYPLFCPLEL